MRRIIPFIASQYRKDKIWLRRAKPQRRIYRIILAIDNSYSVADSGAVGPILEATAILFGAAGLAELGKVAVCSFGATCEIMMPLTDIFNEYLLY